jgi:hypothetical protein
MTTAREVAQWMADEIERFPVLDQSDAAARIQVHFGDGFTYQNRNRNTAISKAVLAEFEQITRATVVWVQESALATAAGMGQRRARAIVRRR